MAHRPTEQWGLPTGSPFESFEYPAELLHEHWQQRGYTIELAGYLVSFEPPEPWPCMNMGDGSWLWVIRRQAWPPATTSGQRNVFLRADWEGGDQDNEPRETYAIGGLEWEHTREQLDGAYAALDMFRERFRVAYGGRPKGSRTGMSAEAAKGALSEVQKLRRHGLAWQVIADRLGIDKRTARRWYTAQRKNGQ